MKSAVFFEEERATSTPVFSETKKILLFFAALRENHIEEEKAKGRKCELGGRVKTQFCVGAGIDNGSPCCM